MLSSLTTSNAGPSTSPNSRRSKFFYLPPQITQQTRPLQKATVQQASQSLHMHAALQHSTAIPMLRGEFFFGMWSVAGTCNLHAHTQLSLTCPLLIHAHIHALHSLTSARVSAPLGRLLRTSMRCYGRLLIACYPPYLVGLQLQTGQGSLWVNMHMGKATRFI
jgi:hypothetical protein